MKHRIGFGLSLLISVVCMVLIVFFIQKNYAVAPITTTTDQGTVATTTLVATTSLPSTTTPAVSPKPTPTPDPIGSSPQRSPFDASINLNISNRVVMSDGLSITLSKIDDSRCKAGVQCMWAGELAPSFILENGTLVGTTKTVTLGTVQKPSIVTDGYTIKLTGATPTSATFLVQKEGGISPFMVLGTVAGTVTLGPLCPVQRPGEPCVPTPEMFTSRSVVIYDTDRVTIVAQQPLQPNGAFTVTLKPGSYFVQINPAGIGAGEKKPFTITALKTTTVNFDIDTGIR